MMGELVEKKRMRASMYCKWLNNDGLQQWVALTQRKEYDIS